MNIQLEHISPNQIEQRSFEIISKELGDMRLDPEQEPIIKRCIHTSADFDYAKNLVFSPNAVQYAKEALKKGACIVTDTQMESQESTKQHWQNLAATYSVLCPMKMLQTQQKNKVQPVLLPAWIKRWL